MQAPQPPMSSREQAAPSDAPQRQARRSPRASGPSMLLATYRKWLSGANDTFCPATEPTEDRKKAVRALTVARRMKLQGRSTLVWFLVLYAIVQLSLTYTMEWWLPVGFRSMLHAKWQRLGEVAAAHPERPLLVMIGSSRTEYALDAARLEDLQSSEGQPFVAYNYGLPSLGTLYSGLSLREMLDAGIRPRLLLVECLFPLLNEAHKNAVSEEAWTAASWLSLPQLTRLWPYFKHPEGKGLDWLEARTVPWYVFRREVQASINGKVHPEQEVKITVPYDEWGHRFPEVISPEEKNKRQNQSIGLYRENLGVLHVGKGPSKSLHDLLTLCKREGIQAVVVSMPESTTFRSWYSDEALAEIDALLAGVRDRFGVQVIDASRWVDDKEFLDFHHVTGEGSRVFTSRLHDELRSILTQQNGAVAQR